jgi:hypothetical protein
LIMFFAGTQKFIHKRVIFHTSYIRTM